MAEVKVVCLNSKDIKNITKVKRAISKVNESENTDSDEMKELTVPKEDNDHSDKQNKKEELEVQEIKDEDKNNKLFLNTSDLDWLYVHLNKKREEGKDVPYLHVLFEGSQIELPENGIVKRNPDLEARCVKLRAQMEAREYRKMTKSVDNVRMRFPEDSISYQMKQLNRQLIAIGQFIISIFAGFLFGFRGVEWMVGNLDFGFRLLLGVMCALVIALAEIYFLAKKLNEELNVPETVQLGGPPKFVNNPDNGYKHTAWDEKEHQD
ncbi:Transmembrane protein 199 [Papilio machaon]|uniref:Transmembrane protein 199 n=1 Tax=Papilio machaon TaxID=76193 RepID=A0A194R1N9_PAPMA|nr:Transmembrane protein 199 [Papilio machaon]